MSVATALRVVCEGTRVYGPRPLPVSAVRVTETPIVPNFALLRLSRPVPRTRVFRSVLGAGALCLIAQFPAPLPDRTPGGVVRGAFERVLSSSRTAPAGGV
ncbi:hypothetical protein GCM10010384_09050 [Streptomyces djakartensis]|uniref:Uncharacterized protein n=1 Tax=Streptomyces djakartensis TaxID=68193 RepID=A0ABQ2Z9I5_9ACTN|nr:hypothetical protein GCM10010384_09050 [Streptomyces djakartensis]